MNIYCNVEAVYARGYLIIFRCSIFEERTIMCLRVCWSLEFPFTQRAYVCSVYVHARWTKFRVDDGVWKTKSYIEFEFAAKFVNKLEVLRRRFPNAAICSTIVVHNYTHPHAISIWDAIGICSQTYTHAQGAGDVADDRVPFVSWMISINCNVVHVCVSFLDLPTLKTH